MPFHESLFFPIIAFFYLHDSKSSWLLRMSIKVFNYCILTFQAWKIVIMLRDLAAENHFLFGNIYSVSWFGLDFLVECGPYNFRNIEWRYYNSGVTGQSRFVYFKRYSLTPFSIPDEISVSIPRSNEFLPGIKS